jgi:hypothetical protein
MRSYLREAKKKRSGFVYTRAAAKGAAAKGAMAKLDRTQGEQSIPAPSGKVRDLAKKSQ